MLVSEFRSWSQTSWICHQHIASLTFVTNIDVTKKIGDKFEFWWLIFYRLQIFFSRTQFAPVFFFFWGHVFRKFQRFQTVLKRSSIQFNRLGFDTKNISGRVVPIHSEYQNRFSKITLVHHFRNIFNQKWVGSNKLWFLAVPMLVKDNGENVCCRKTCMLVKRSSTYFTNMD